MPVTQPDLWKSGPFDGKLVEQAPYKKVLIGRGAVNSKGPEMAMLNALMSIKAIKGKLPVNLIFVAEGDEERMDIGYNKFVYSHPELFKGVDAMYTFGFQSPNGTAGPLSGSEGCVFIELTTSGAKWGKGPVYSDIHGGNKRSVDSPAWRHIQMLSKLVSEDGNKVLIPGFYDNMEPLSAADDAKLKAGAKGMDLKKAAQGLGVARFISDDPYQVLRMSRYGTSMNLDGIWGGNMFAGGSGAILPNKITSKHNFRYIPNMTGPDIVAKLRKYLDKLGYSDVEINVVGDVPWAKRNTDNEIGRAVYAAFDQFNIGHGPISPINSIMGGYWPAYLFAGNGAPFDIPIVGGMLGYGGNAHAANEFYVIEGAGKTYGMAGAEKSVVAVLYNYAGLNGPVVVAAGTAEIVPDNPIVFPRFQAEASMSIISLQGLKEDVQAGRQYRSGACRRIAQDRPGRVRLHHRAIGLGKIDVDAYPRLPRSPDRGQIHVQRQGCLQPPARRARGHPEPADRISSSRASTCCRARPQSRMSRCRCSTPGRSCRRRCVAKRR